MTEADADIEPAATTCDAFLGGALQILQPSRAYRAGLDAVLLAAAMPAPASHTHASPIRVLDAGAGVGVVGLCVARRVAQARVTLVERERELASLASLNVERNNLDGRIRVICQDLRAPAPELAAAGLSPDSFDIVMANPPYDEQGAGRPPPDPLKAGANLMAAGDLDRWARFLVRMAAPRGLLLMIHRADALGRILAALDGRFGAVEVLPIHPREKTPAHRILLRARKASGAPMTIHQGLVLHGDGNGFVAEIDRVLRNGAPLTWPDISA